jgi:transcriptional regulator with XRE-family HTH domain
MSANLSNRFGMSPRRISSAVPQRVETAMRRVTVLAGQRARDERVRRGWTLRRLADEAGLSPSLVQSIEAGGAGSLEAYARLADALGLRLQEPLTAIQRGTGRANLSADLVHSAMTEIDARRFRGHKLPHSIDEPYQHYQFAGRADLVAWSLEEAALLHIENRTRFPDLQAVAGSYNAKRVYLPDALAARLGIRRWRSETHVMVCLWSAEVLHALRLRTESFRALFPDPADSFAAWWDGRPPAAGVTSTLVVLDPLAVGRQRAFVDLETALGVDPRHRGYAAAAAALGLVG